MLNRRFLRIKTFQALYAWNKDKDSNKTLYESNLFKSLDKTYELYIFLLSFAIEFSFFINKELEAQHTKHIPKSDLINLLKVFDKNLAMKELAGSPRLDAEIKALKIKWNGNTIFFRNIFNELKESEIFSKFNSANIEDDKAILIAIYEQLVAQSDLFNSFVEERYIAWEDDMTLTVLTLQKTIANIKTDSDNFLIKFSASDSEDIKFMKHLFRQTIENEEELTKLIAIKTQNWDTDRIASVDMMLMKMTISEILYFSEIPVKVSINEYMEIAKLYSSPNSFGFINGILDKIQLDLREQNKINKLGRGLLE